MTFQTISQREPFGFAAFGNGPTEEQQKCNDKIWFRVLVSQIPPRNSRFEFYLEMGRQHIDAVLEHKKLDIDGYIMFCFPERWMNAKEQMLFIPLLQKHPLFKKSKGITTVDIITASPLIVTNLHKDDLAVFKEEKAKEGGLSAKTHELEKKLKL